jgi:hypothetical protein
MVKKMTTLLLLVILLSWSTERVQNVFAGGGGGERRVISIPAAAFRPSENGFTYYNRGYWLTHTSGAGWSFTESVYFAPVHLPHWAAITGLTAYIADENPTKSATVDLVEANLATGTVSSWIASVSSPAGTSSYFEPYSISGIYQVVDNQNHAYYLRYSTPREQTSSDEILLGGVQISYLEGAPASPGYFSLTGADFTPFSEHNSYINSGCSLEEASTTVTRDFQAGVILPNGARLDRMTFYYYGVSGKTLSANLYKTNTYGDYIYVNALTSGVIGNGSSSSTTFASDRIDNRNFAYWLYYRFAFGPIPYGVVIEYTPKIYSTGLDEGFFSIPAASFVPAQGNYSYENHGRFIFHKNEGGISRYGDYVAPIAPPQGSSATSLFFMVGNSPYSNFGTLGLGGVSDKFAEFGMWSQKTLTAGGWYAIGSSAILPNPFNYRHNLYYMQFYLPPSTSSNWVRAVGGRGQWAYRNFSPSILYK